MGVPDHFLHSMISVVAFNRGTKAFFQSGGYQSIFSKYWCKQASSAAQVCKEINKAKRSAIYLQNEQGMDGAQRAEKRRLGGNSSKSDGLKL